MQSGQQTLVPIACRGFGKAKPVPVRPAVEEQGENDAEQNNKELEFVMRQPNLRQVFLRQPSDGLYPKMKSVHEMEAEDVPELASMPQPDKQLEELVAKRAYARDNPKLVNALIGHLYDKNGKLIEQMYAQLLKERLKHSGSPLMSSLSYNLMMQSAALFKRHRLLDQLTFESSIFDVPIDNQTYIKTIMCLYYDLNRTKQSKDHLQYMYAVYKNDVPTEDYQFGSELILEYVNAAAAAAKLHQHQPDGQDPKQHNGKKNRRRSRDKKGHMSQLASDKQ